MLKKVQFKLGDGSWVHFCYVDSELKGDFVTVSDESLAPWVKRWAEEDYNLSQVDTPEELAELKEAIRQEYQEKYPELFLPSRTDNQGWVRVWLTQHIKEELEKDGEKLL